MSPKSFTLEDYKAHYEYYKLKCKRLQEELSVAKEQLREQKNISSQTPKRTDNTTESAKLCCMTDYDTRPQLPDVPIKSIRGKKRKQLPGYACEDCSKFYDAAGLGPEIVQQCTRHRGEERPKTPPGFWDIGWHSPEKNK